MSNQQTALVGIDPQTRKVIIVGINDAGTVEDIVKYGLIMVPTTLEKARVAFGEVVEDVFARFCEPAQEVTP